MTDSGKRRRLQRILPDGKTVIIPMDHGVSDGPIPGLVRMREIVEKLKTGGVDAIVVHKGIARNVDTGHMGLIVHLSGSTKLGPDVKWKVKVCSVLEAIRIGADAVSVHINVGAPQEPQMLAKLGDVADDCDEFGVPLLAMMYPRGPNIPSEHDPEVVSHAARIGAELGADVVKTPYTGSIETFRRVVDACPVPVVIAGGPKAKTDAEVLKMVYDSMKAGAAGISIGRNVFQNSNPGAMGRALSSIVHGGASVEQAVSVLRESK